MADEYDSEDDEDFIDQGSGADDDGEEGEDEMEDGEEEMEDDSNKLADIDEDVDKDELKEMKK